MGILFIRTVLLYIIMTAAMRLMGKRQVGELQPLELTVTVIISNIASLPLEHTTIPLFNGLIPVVTLVALEVLMSYLSLKSRGLRRLISGKPVTVIFDGRIRQKALQMLRFSVDDLMEELRTAGVFDPAQVQLAVVETSGKLSVHKRPEHDPLTPSSLAGLTVRVGSEQCQFAMQVTDGNDRPLIHPPPGPMELPSVPPPPFVAVSDGVVESENLAQNGMQDRTVFAILQKENAELPDVLLLTLDTQRRYYLVRRADRGEKP